MAMWPESMLLATAHLLSCLRATSNGWEDKVDDPGARATNQPDVAGAHLPDW